MGFELDLRESEPLDFQKKKKKKKNCLLPLPCIQALSLQIWKTRTPLAAWLVHAIRHRLLIFKFRTIFHLSFPKSGTTSINSSISKEDFSHQFVTIDNVIERIKRFGQGCFLTLNPLSGSVHSDDYELLGMFWNGK